MATGVRRIADQYKWISKGYGRCITVGTSDFPINLRVDDQSPIQLYTTSALTTGTNRAFLINQTQTATKTAGYERVLDVVLASAYKTGGDGAVIRAQCDYTGGGCAHGIMNVLTTELKLPNSSLTRGALYAFEMRINASASSSWGSAGPVGFIRVKCAGTPAALDTGAYFMIFTGHTGAAGKLVSLTSQTVKCSFSGEADPTTTVRYALFSQMEDGLGLGVSGTPMSLVTDANHSVEIHTTSADAAGFLAANRFYHTQAGNTTGGHWAMWVQNTVAAENVGSGAMYVKLDCATFDAPTGGNSALNVEMVLANCTHAGGSYHPFVIDVDCGGPALVMHGNAAIPCGFMKLEAYGTDVGEWDDHGYLFTIRGLTAADHHLVDNSATNIAFVADVLLKINIGGTEYWLGACDNEAGTT